MLGRVGSMRRVECWANVLGCYVVRALGVIGEQPWPNESVGDGGEGMGFDREGGENLICASRKQGEAVLSALHFYPHFRLMYLILIVLECIHIYYTSPSPIQLPPGSVPTNDI
jgi:hypothetical protein